MGTLDVDDDDDHDAQNAQESGADGESEDDWSDTSSMLHDILNGEEDVGDPVDVVPKEEASQLKEQLRKRGPNDFIKETITNGRYSAKTLLTIFGVQPPLFFEGREDDGYYRLLGMAIVRFLTSRQKLSQYNTIDDVVSLIQKSKKIMVITGAGVRIQHYKSGEDLLPM